MPTLRLLALLLLGTTTLSAAELQTINGQKLVGDLVKLDANQIVLRTAMGEVTTPVKQVLLLDLKTNAPKADESKYTDVELVDGTLLHCDDVKIRGKTVSVTLHGMPKETPAIDIPLKFVFTMLRDAQDKGQLAEWKSFLSRRGKRDIIAIKKSGKFDGLEGTAEQGDETGEKILFDLANGGRQEIRLSRVSGLVFNQLQQGEVSETLCKVTDGLRNVYSAKEVTQTPQGFKLVTVTGLPFEFQNKPMQLAKLDYSKDKITYLSDLEPSQATLPEDDRTRYLTQKRTNSNNSIEMGGVAYSRGLVLQAPYDVSYDLSGEYTEFKAVVGFDTANGISSSAVELTIEGDGRNLIKTVIKHKDEPRTIVLNLKEVRTLRIVVTQAEGSSLIGSEVNLADARINK